MVGCDRAGCAWRAIAPSGRAAYEQYVEHLVEAHAAEVDADIPDGMVQIRIGRDGEWVTMPIEEAKRLHERYHGLADRS